MSKPMSIKLNSVSTAIIRKLQAYYSSTMNLTLSNSKVIEMALKDLEEKVDGGK